MICKISRMMFGYIQLESFCEIFILSYIMDEKNEQKLIIKNMSYVNVEKNRN